MPELILPNNGWRPRDYQQRFWDAWQKEDCNRLIGVWHRRAGKDDVCLHGSSIKLHERIANYWHCLPEYAQARKAIWDAVNAHTGKRRIHEAFPPELVESYNDQEMKIRFKIGSTWQVIGSDRYDSLVGSGIAGVTFSEWALANPSAWGYIKPMLRENNGWAAFISTPRGRNHLFTMFNGYANDPDWFVQKLTARDTGALTDADMAKELRDYIIEYGEDLGTAKFAQEYLCDFNAAILGAFYAREMVKVRNEGRIAEFEAVNAPVHRAWDIGVSDDTSIWWFQVVAGQVRLLDCYSDNGAGIDHYAEVCAEREKKHGWQSGVDFVPHDAQQRQFVLKKARTILQQMQAYGFRPELVPNVSKANGIAAARRTLSRSVFHTRCEEIGVAALEQYRREWDDDKKTFRKTEVHDWTSHLADAFRYLSLVWRTAKRDEAPPPPKPKPGDVLLPGMPEPESSVRIEV